VTEVHANKEELQKAIDVALAEQQWVSDRLSTQVRTLAVGCLAVAWGLIVSPPDSIRTHPRALLAIAGLAIFALMLDLAQYIFGYLNTTRLLGKIERERVVVKYSKTALLWRLRVKCFWGKLLVTLLAAICLIILLVKAILPVAQS